MNVSKPSHIQCLNMAIGLFKLKLNRIEGIDL